jgi:hypothetical protein
MVFTLHQTGSGEHRIIMGWKRGNRLKLVSEAEAPASTREIFDELRRCLGVPVVPTLYQAYAAYPEFLKTHWQAFRPTLESRQFFLLGARLAAESYTRAHNYFEMRGLSARETSDASSPLPLSQVLDYYQYLDPLLLLISVAQMQAFDGPVGQAQIAAEPASHPVFPVSPCLLNPADVPAAVQRVWEERRRTLDQAFVSEEHRALALWPAFYQEYWLSLQPLLQSPLYADCQHRMLESAWTLVRELPIRVETSVFQLLDAGMCEEELAAITRVNQFCAQALSTLLLDITFARIGCEGGTRRQAVESAPEERPQKLPVEPSTKRSGSPTRAA